MKTPAKQIVGQLDWQEFAGSNRLAMYQAGLWGAQLSPFGQKWRSIGGGGGNGSDATAISVDFAVAVGGDGGAGGAGGIITMNDTTTDGNSVKTDGDNSDGISLQSIGGGGGKGGNAIVATGSVGFDVTIGASGDGAAGLAAVL
ncbi:MAG: hypothetical protein V7744_07720 [Pseudomonadales bacterium]